MHMFLVCMYLRNVCDNDCMSVSFLTATVYLDYSSFKYAMARGF